MRRKAERRSGAPTGKCLLLGLAAGLLNGLLGTGGGLVAVPLLSGPLGLSTREAFATSLTVMLPLSAVTLAGKLWQTGAPPLSAAPYILGGIAGGILAGRLICRIPTKWLRGLFALLILWGGIRAVMGW